MLNYELNKEQENLVERAYVGLSLIAPKNRLPILAKRLLVINSTFNPEGYLEILKILSTYSYNCTSGGKENIKKFIYCYLYDDTFEDFINENLVKDDLRIDTYPLAFKKIRYAFNLLENRNMCIDDSGNTSFDNLSVTQVNGDIIIKSDNNTHFESIVIKLAK